MEDLPMRSLQNKLAALVALLALIVAGGCASPVPGGGNGVGLSGKRITITIQCYAAMSPSFYYFFLINRLGPNGSQNANGPIPVLGPAVQGNNGTIGNGFATGSGITQT